MTDTRVNTTLLMIMDGWGVAPPSPSNPVTATNAPHYFAWKKEFPYTELKASGEAVGLPRGQEGNSEAGHLNLGAGRVIEQDAVRISAAIADGTFFKNNAFIQAVRYIKKYRAAAHVMGLLSNHNSAHSTPEQLYALLDLLHREGITRVYLHLFTDGRDSGQHDAPHLLKKLEAHFHGTEQVATIMGRLYAMDRNKLWERTKAAYDAIVSRHAPHRVENPQEALAQAYNRAESDEFVAPTLVQVAGGDRRGRISAHDGIFFFNLRSDRARQLTKAFVQPDFEHINHESFRRRRVLTNIRFVAMTDFGPDLPGVLTAFPSCDVAASLVATLCPRRQLYIAESEKFAHITYFFNGGYAHHFCDERWVKITSDPISHYEDRPAMKAKHIADYVIRAIKQHHFEFIAVNFANADMIGHTGDWAAAVAAVTTLDHEIYRVVQTLLKEGGQGILTADHGNIEEMKDLSTSEVNTEHSRNLVPCVILAGTADWRRYGQRRASRPQVRRGGSLSNVAPTLLKMMGLPQPPEMTAKALF